MAMQVYVSLRFPFASLGKEQVANVFEGVVFTQGNAKHDVGRRCGLGVTAGPSADRNHLADELRLLNCNGLTDESAHRKPQHIYLLAA
jgi:hypothetical protein